MRLRLLDLNLKAAYTAEVISYEAQLCPICKEGNIPLIKPGSSK